MVKELLAHVADKRDPAFDQCLNAIKALYLHNGDETSYRFIATPEMLIAKAFFNRELPQNEENNKALVQICFHLAKNPSRHVFQKLTKNLLLNKQHMENAEKSFAYSMKNLLNAVDPAATGWHFFEDDEKKTKRISCLCQV